MKGAPFLTLAVAIVNLPAFDSFSVERNLQAAAETGGGSSRRQFLHVSLLGTAALVARPSLALAKEEGPPSRQMVAAAFDDVRNELNGANGGVAKMQERIDEGDFVGLMEYTKGYDLDMRKIRMGKAKKMLQSKEAKNQATEYSNAVTFDLIGMNRSSRPGQENKDSANKYLQELRDDVNKFLELESTIEVFSD